jgi:hypothetical protein
MWAAKRAKMDFYFVSYKARRFRHCFVMIVYPGGGLRIESLWARLDIEPYSQLGAVTALELFNELGWYVEKVAPGNIPIPRLPGLGTCVSITKRVLGINKPWLLTVKQLKRWIKWHSESVGHLKKPQSIQAHILKIKRKRPPH